MRLSLCNCGCFWSPDGVNIVGGWKALQRTRASALSNNPVDASGAMLLVTETAALGVS